MEDYPRTVGELEDRFATEQACRDYLVALRWPAGFRCPLCGHYAFWPVGKLFECRKCGHQTSVTAGIIFQDTRKPLRQWFRAAWYVTSQKTEASALGMQQILGLGGYLTAWSWLHKLRRAMVRPGRDCLKGEVEIDEAYLGGLEEGVYGRQTFKKALIVVAAEKDGTRGGRRGKGDQIGGVGALNRRAKGNHPQQALEVAVDGDRHYLGRDVARGKLIGRLGRFTSSCVR